MDCMTVLIGFGSEQLYTRAVITTTAEVLVLLHHTGAPTVRATGAATI